MRIAPIAWLIVSFHLSAACLGEAPMEVPRKLPASPAEVVEFLANADAAETHMKDLVAKRSATRNAQNQSLNVLRYGAFRAAGGLDDADFKKLAAAVADLDAQMRARRDAMAIADRKGDKDERAALEIEAARLRVRKDAAQAAADAFVLNRCLGLPQALTAARQVQELMRQAAEADQAQRDYVEILDEWRGLARAYRQAPDGADLNRTRSLTLPPPADAARRMDEFVHRNDPAAIELLAHRLFRSLDEKSPGLDKPFALYRSREFSAAIEAFREYFLDKMANLEKYGVTPDSLLADQRPLMGAPTIKQEWVDDAMKGIATQPNRNVSANELLKITVGPPGAVNWAYVPAEPLTAQKMPVWLQVMRQFHLLERESSDSTDGLRCWLMDAYHATGDAKYLARWAEYADDWAINMQRDLNALRVEELPAGSYDPVAIRRDGRLAPYRWNVRWYPTLIPRQAAMFATRLRALALSHPGTIRQLPATTLARVLLVVMDEYLSPNILVARATRFNWNMMGLSFNVRNGILFGEFKAAQWAGREAARTFQNHAVFSIMPDGGYVEYSDEGHQGVWLERAPAALSLWRQQRAAWFDTIFADEFTDVITRNAEFFIRHLSPDGYRHRDDYRNARGVFVGHQIWQFGPHSLDAQAPWVAGAGEGRRVVSAVYGLGEPAAPAHLSDVMPCLGEFMLRGAWKPDAAFFYMHSGRIPNSNPDEDCNAYKLHDFGRHLLTAQPVYVDGRTQNSHFKHVDNVGAKTAFLTYSDTQPAMGRWHTSEHFDLAEGVYEGAYEDREGRVYWSTFRAGGFDMKRQQRSLGKPAITDVRRHARQVIFIRQPAAWIVIDRIRCDAKHDYEAPFELYTPVDKVDWLRRGKAPIPNAERRVMMDEASHVIRTDNPGYPRVTLHQLCSSPLQYQFDPISHDLAHKDSGEIRDAEREWKLNRPELKDMMAFVRRTLVKWTGQGDQMLVTLITTAAPGDEANWKFAPAGATAFAAIAPDGATIHFAAAVHAGSLTAGDVTLDGDALLVVKTRNGDAHGLLLSDERTADADERSAMQTRGFEFTAAAGRVVPGRAIYPPVKPVAFEPNVNVFTDAIDVTLRAAAPGVEIRYTVDGREPTAESPRYDKPLRLTQTTVVRAIAMRAGANETCWPFDPGYASLPARAVFIKQSLAPAANVGRTQDGLAWEYAEGQPFALVANSDTFAAQKTGAAASLFDVSMHRNGSAFVARYDGYIDVPRDGVYTFHAPREFVIPDIDPGYDLRVFVDDEEWWPAMRWHAMGTWSRALARGPHRFRAIFVDTRTNPYKYETWQNWPNAAVLWKGVAPVLEVSGPGIARQPVPDEWLKRLAP